jgi:outer membrane protein assembly factor BamB
MTVGSNPAVALVAAAVAAFAVGASVLIAAHSRAAQPMPGRCRAPWLDTIANPAKPELPMPFHTLLHRAAGPLVLALVTACLATPTRAEAASWPQAGFDAAHTWFNPTEKRLRADNAATLTQVWSRQLGQFYIGQTAQSKGAIVVCSNLFGISVLNADDGKKQGNLTTLEGDNCGTPAIHGALAYVTTSGTEPNVGYLTALDNAATVLWTATSADPLSLGFEDPALASRTLFVADRRNSLYAFDAATGAIRWRAETGALNNAAAVRDGSVVITTWGVAAGPNRVWAFAAKDGALRWASDGDHSNMQYPALITDSTTEALAITAADSGSVRAFSLASGALRWQAAVPGYVSAPIAAAKGAVFVVSGSRTISALSTDDGSVRWRTALDQASVSSNLALANGLIFCTVIDSGAHRLAVYRASTGEPIAQIVSTSLTGTFGKLTVVEGRVQVATNQGVLHVFALPAALSEMAP